jgi:hypothetical protein
MAYTEADRVQIRHFMGAGTTFLQLFPKLENAITVTQSVVDGGTRPDNSTELYLKSVITDLQAVESKLKDLHIQVQVVEANQKEIVLNVAQGVYLLRSEGRRMVGNLSRLLACAPVYDCFSSQAPSSDDFANIYKAM